MSAVPAPNIRPGETPAVDREHIADTIRRLMATRDALEKARERVRTGEEREAELCRELASAAHSLSGFVIDGMGVAIGVTHPGKVPLVVIRPVRVL